MPEHRPHDHCMIASGVCMRNRVQCSVPDVLCFLHPKDVSGCNFSLSCGFWYQTYWSACADKKVYEGSMPAETGAEAFRPSAHSVRGSFKDAF